MIEAYPIGSQITITDNSSLDGKIDEILISELGCKYKVSWWNKDEKKHAWLTESEFYSTSEKTTIGFKSDN